MNPFLFTTIALFVTTTLFSQPINETVIDPKDSSLMLYGYFTRDILTKAPFSNWYQKEYEEYTPDKKTMKVLTRKMPNNLQIFLVMGSWCSDSQREVPRFLKILDLSGFHSANLTLVGVDRKKKTTHINMEHLAIERVPTFIFYYNNQEARIIETPKTTLEKDLLEIIRNVK